MTWANKHAAAGFVLAYCALQPLTSTLLSVAIVSSGASTELSMPGFNLLGALPILIGLLLLLRDGQHAHGSAAKVDAATSDEHFVQVHGDAHNQQRDPLLHTEHTDQAISSASMRERVTESEQRRTSELRS